MMRLPIVFAYIAMLLPWAAFAQEKPPTRAAISEEVKLACRREVRKICPNLIPDRAAIQRCVAENRDKISAQCVTVIQSN